METYLKLLVLLAAIYCFVQSVRGLKADAEAEAKASAARLHDEY
jgi:hypothetical protein